MMSSPLQGMAEGSAEQGKMVGKIATAVDTNLTRSILIMKKKDELI